MLGAGLRLLQALGKQQSRQQPTMLLTMARVFASQPNSKVEKASVRLQDGAKVVLSLTVKGRTRNLTRDEQEPLSTTLLRLQLLITPLQATTVPQGFRGGITPKAYFYRSTTPSSNDIVPDDLPCRQALEQARMLVLDNTHYILEHYTPEITSAKVHGRLYVGLPYTVHAEVVYSHPDACEYLWQRSARPLKMRAGTPPDAATKWIDVGHARLYTPTEEDAGHAIRVQCTPVRRCFPWEVENTALPSQNPPNSSTDEVRGTPITIYLDTVRQTTTPWGFHSRIVDTPTPVQAPQLRVVTYNTLAECYSQTERAKRHLFPDCPPWALASGHRLPAILGELLGYHADVIALQEVDAARFTDTYYPALKHCGYDGLYTPKAHGLEGAALFWRASRYRKVAHKDVLYRALIEQALRGDGPPPASVAPVLPMIQGCPKLQQVLLDIGQVAQMVCLAPVDQPVDHPHAYDTATPTSIDGPLCVVNTHLYFHNGAPHIRTIHASMLAHEAAHFSDEMGGTMGATSISTPTPPAIVLCGDLNSDPTHAPFPGCVELLRSGRLPDTHFDWAVGSGFVFERREEEEEENAAASAQEQAPDASTGPVGATLQLPLCLSSADGFTLPYTNYVRTFVGMLDYVWHEPMRMRSVRVLPIPPIRETLPALPAPQWPSDHLAVVADLEWLSHDAQQAWRPSGTHDAPQHCTTYNHPGTWHTLPVKAFMAPVAQASWAFNTPVQLPYGGNEYLALPAASPAALPRLLSVLQHDKDSSERPSSDTSNAPRAVLAVHKVATTASRLFDFSGGSVQLMAVLLTTPNVVLHLPLLPSTRATLGDVTSAGMMLLQQDDAVLQLLPHIKEQEQGLWMLPVPSTAGSELDMYGRPQHWARVGAVFEDSTALEKERTGLTWVRVQGVQVEVMVKGTAMPGLASIVADAGGMLVDCSTN